MAKSLLFPLFPPFDRTNARCAARSSVRGTVWVGDALRLQWWVSLFPQDALQQRLTQQDTSVLQLKQELLRANMDKDELHNQNVS